MCRVKQGRWKMRVGLGVVLICAVVCCPADARGINTFVAPDTHYYPLPPPRLHLVRCKDGTVIVSSQRCPIKPPVMERTAAGKAVDTVTGVVRSLTGHNLGFRW